MDKFIKRLQTRLSRKGVKVTKDQVREVYRELVVNLDFPTDEEMVVATDLLLSKYQKPEESRSNLATTQELPQPQQMTTPKSALATSSRSAISQLDNTQLGITQTAIQEAVEQQFGNENQQTKQAILNYVAQDTFSTAQELQSALVKLRSMRLDILMKLISDHNEAASADETLLKTALANATAQRQRETEDFFGSFENQMLEMRAAFGV